MKSKIFSITLFNYPHEPVAIVYRTDGTPLGGGLKFYHLTVTRLIRLVRVMGNVSSHNTYSIRNDGDSSTWSLPKVVPTMYAAQARLREGNGHE